MNRILNVITQKVKQNIKQMGNVAGEWPEVSDGRYFQCSPRELKHVFSWTQGFWTGMAGISYEITGDREYLKWIYSLYGQFYDKVHKYCLDTMHDLGFIYSLYAVMMYKLTGDEKMKELGISAANCLAMRYVPQGHYIRAWNRMDGQIPDYVDEELAKDHFFTESDGLMIVDCMMNLPLLFWASEETGHPFYKSVAISHIDMAVKYLVREDYSIIHAYRFHPETGEPMQPENYCGYGVDSYWARGTSWMIYGLVIAYKYTGKEEYLDLFEKITAKFIESCEADGIPVWDFRIPEEVSHAKDTSAAAVVCCGITLYQRYRSNEVFSSYVEKTMDVLANQYFNSSLDVNGLPRESNGRNVYTSYGDYYFLEALAMRERGLEIYP